MKSGVLPTGSSHVQGDLPTALQGSSSHRQSQHYASGLLPILNLVKETKHMVHIDESC